MEASHKATQKKSIPRVHFDSYIQKLARSLNSDENLADDLVGQINLIVETTLQNVYYQLLRVVDIYHQSSIDKKVMITAIRLVFPRGPTIDEYLEYSSLCINRNDESHSTEQSVAERCGLIIPPSLVSKYLHKKESERGPKLAKSGKILLAAIIEQLVIAMIKLSSGSAEGKTLRVKHLRLGLSRDPFIEQFFKFHQIVLIDDLEGGLLLHRDPFSRLIRRLVGENSKIVKHLGKHVIDVIQYYAESETIEYIKRGVLILNLNNRNTLTLKHLAVCSKIIGISPDHPQTELKWSNLAQLAIAAGVERKSEEVASAISSYLIEHIQKLLLPSLEIAEGLKRATLDIKLLKKGARLVGIILPIVQKK